MSRVTPAGGAATAGSGRATRSRQRQRLIDACISALHIHGPSRTTVEKVVAIADLSPGIVRFYFDSKAAMLVASLEYLAAEFEERVLLPVSQLRQSPVQALELLVDLYLDAEIASPRKVSVWYSFWGEASSRQEYYDICGKRDEEFAALVRELIERLIAHTGAAHLDADGVALGLIGVLEVLWQGFAFQSEASIDRAAARARALAYLRSVFPGQFARAATAAAPTPPPAADGDGSGATALSPATPAAAADHALPASARLPAWAYAHAALLAAERERLLRPAWQIIGHDAEVPAAGDFLSADLAGERALVVRDERGRLHAFRNACRRRPHALVIARTGHLEGAIHCASHNLTYRLDGRLVDGDTPGDLSALGLTQWGRLIVVRAAGAAPAALGAAAGIEWGAFDRMTPVGAQQIQVAADWKLIVERWLEMPVPQRAFLAPNQLIEVRRDAALILQVIPVAAGRCRMQRFDYIAAALPRRARASKGGSAAPGGAAQAAGVWQRQINAWLQQEIALAESTQTGLAGAPEEPEDAGPIPGPLLQFRQSITALLPAIPTLPERAL